jgi:hypothetical protein
MSENITHTAVVDDCLRLMLASESICSPFKTAAQQHLPMAQLGCMTRAGDRCNPGLLDNFRTRWSQRKPDDHLEAKLAFVLGWLCHRAADRQMKPVFRRFHPPEQRQESPTECSIYHDAYLFRTIYANGQEPPYYPAMFGDQFRILHEKIDVENVQKLARILLRRALIEMHTLIPDTENPEKWIDQLLTRRQEFYVNLERYDRAITHPDPEKVKLYITDDNFYDPDEAIIASARKLQHGLHIAPADIKSALESKPHSHYGTALHTGMRYLCGASDFFSSEMTVDRLHTILDIGKPGRDGIAV